jgi:hypothetical protein
MTDDELRLAFQKKLKDDDNLLDMTKSLTNGVPLYAAKFLGDTYLFMQQIQILRK